MATSAEPKPDSNRSAAIERLERVQRVYWWMTAAMVVGYGIGAAVIVYFLILLVVRGPDDASARFVSFIFLVVAPGWVATALNILYVSAVRRGNADERIWAVAIFIVDLALLAWYIWLVSNGGETLRHTLGHERHWTLSLGIAIYGARSLVDVWGSAAVLRYTRRGRSA